MISIILIIYNIIIEACGLPDNSGDSIVNRDLLNTNKCWQYNNNFTNSITYYIKLNLIEAKTLL